MQVGCACSLGLTALHHGPSAVHCRDFYGLYKIEHQCYRLFHEQWEYLVRESSLRPYGIPAQPSLGISEVIFFPLIIRACFDVAGIVLNCLSMTCVEPIPLEVVPLDSPVPLAVIPPSPDAD